MFKAMQDWSNQYWSRSYKFKCFNGLLRKLSLHWGKAIIIKWGQSLYLCYNEAKQSSLYWGKAIIVKVVPPFHHLCKLVYNWGKAQVKVERITFLLERIFKFRVVLHMQEDRKINFIFMEDLCSRNEENKEDSSSKTLSEHKERMRYMRWTLEELLPVLKIIVQRNWVTLAHLFIWIIF